jgi:hypothetical protein
MVVVKVSVASVSSKGAEAAFRLLLGAISMATPLLQFFAHSLKSLRVYLAFQSAPSDAKGLGLGKASMCCWNQVAPTGVSASVPELDDKMRAIFGGHIAPMSLSQSRVLF